MDYEIRYARPDEWSAVAELDGASFGFHYSDDERADAELDLDPKRIMIATTGDAVIGISAELPFAMLAPGGADVPVVGLSWVSVELTHRRQGVLRAMLEKQLREQAAAGATALILSASEGGIYGRYGFGVATEVRHTVVERRRAQLTEAVDTSAVRRLTTDAARDVLPELYERWRRESPGGLSRDERRWQFTLLDREYQRHGRSGLFHLVHPDGYVTYRIKSEWGEGDPRHECWLVDYAPASAHAHAALWQTLLSMDLVATIHSYRVPLDDPLQLMLADPRGVLTTHLGDALWVRPLDVAALLGSRRYALDVDCVLEVRDDVLGDGRYLLRGGPDGASCARTDRGPDVRLGVADLGAAYLGGTRVAGLARAGRIVAEDATLVGRLDLAFGADRHPAHGTPF
jgi:predicted acetyltransferase